MPSPPPRERLPGIDVLRGLAAIAVLAFHFTTRFGMIFGHPTPPAFFVPWGQRGVEVFFVISGFAIELSLGSRGGARDFLSARAIRLFPTFWAAVAVTFAVVGIFGLPDRAVSLRDAFLNLTMIPASLGAGVVDAVYWTLERELRFYGLVILLLALGLPRYTLHALGAAVAVQALGAVVTGVPRWVADVLNLGWAHLFAAGVLLARLHRRPSWGNTALLGLSVLSARAVGPLPFAYGAGAVALVWLASRPGVGQGLGPLVFLGKISYPLYLVHQYVGYVVMRGLYARGASTGVGIAAACGVTIATAAALHFAVEAPCLALLRRRKARTVAGRPPSDPGARRARTGLIRTRSISRAA